MTHAEFVNAYAAGKVKVAIDPAGAARFMSSRLLLPLFMMPVTGAGIALALTGYLWPGLAVIVASIIAPRLIKRSAPHFILTQILENEKFYDEIAQSGILRIMPR